MAQDFVRLQAIAHDIRDAAEKTQRGTEQGAADIARLTNQLASVVRGSRTGESSIVNLNQAVRVLRDTSSEFSAVAHALDDFIARSAE